MSKFFILLILLNSYRKRFLSDEFSMTTVAYYRKFSDKAPYLSNVIMQSIRFPHLAFHTTVRDFGVTLDSALTFSQHISNLTRSSYSQLRRLRTCRKAVSVPIFISIVHAFVCFRIDYCNSLLIGLPKTGYLSFRLY